MPYVEFVLREEAAALRQLLLVETVGLAMSDDPRAAMRAAQLRGLAHA